MAKIIDKIKDGIGFGLGLILVFGLLIGVYAFVEPTKGPSSNYVFDWSNPFANKVNNTNSIVNNTNNIVKEVKKITIGLSPNTGQYDNRIPVGSFPRAYTEVCFKGGASPHDIHTAGQSTAGGNCLPGDVGFIAEKNVRTIYSYSTEWTNAKANCLKDGMRLPEPFEWQYSCKNKASFGLNFNPHDFEWASNFVSPMMLSFTSAIVSSVMINFNNCNEGIMGQVGSGVQIAEKRNFRCFK